MTVGLFVQGLYELETVLFESFRLVVAFLDQVVELFFQIVEKHRVLVDVL